MEFTSEENILQSLVGIDYGYDYPVGLDIRPDSDLHNLIVTRVLARATESRNIVKNRYPSWNALSKSLTAFVDPDEVRAKKLDPSKKITLVVPMTYASLETVLTYLVSALLDDPLFRYTWGGPEDVIGTILMEKVIGFQATKAKMMLNLHTMLRDAVAYGVGVVNIGWHRKMGYKKIAENPSYVEVLGVNVPMEPTLNIVRSTLWEGNKLTNLDPYTILPDPNTPIHALQDGEFFGWIERQSYPDLLSSEIEGSEGYFNIKYLKNISGESRFYTESRAERSSNLIDKMGTYSWFTGGTTRPKDTIYMFIKLIPNEWHLGTSDIPEKWLFGVSGDRLVIMAKKMNMLHDMFPIATCAPDFDGYSTMPVARCEVVFGMQDVLDFLFTSHMDNVAKAVHDSFIVDPSRINMPDLTAQQGPKIIRLRKDYWGSGVREAIEQLKVSDITRSHISDSAYVIDIMQRAMCASDSMQGVVRTGSERRTAEEYRQTKMAGLSRLERAARVAAVQSKWDLAYMCASHTQQLMEEDVFVSIIGEWQEILEKEYGTRSDRVRVTPDMMDVDYNIISEDGTVPDSESAEDWLTLFKLITVRPELAERFDIVRVFKHVARLLGAKNVENFEVKVKPTEEVEKQVEKGEVTPIEEVENAAV